MTTYGDTSGKEVDLKAEQARTLQVPVMSANVLLRSMYCLLDLLYGSKRTLAKFKVIEILARYPYWSWENGSYHRLTRLYASASYCWHGAAEQALRHIELGRWAQDNEQWHLMLIEDVMRQKGIRQKTFSSALIPRLLSFGYHLMCRCIYRIRPQWSFATNARFESHAEHEYMRLVQEHPEWESEPVESEHFKHYPRQRTLADLFRRIGLDERGHMHESMQEYERLAGRPFPL